MEASHKKVRLLGAVFWVSNSDRYPLCFGGLDSGTSEKMGDVGRTGISQDHTPKGLQQFLATVL